MKKWGVRLIALLFFIGAILDAYGLIKGTRHAQGGLGFDLGLTYNGQPIDVMAWVEVVVFIYVGVQLLRFHPSGRFLALAIFWVSVFSSTCTFSWMIVLMVKDWTSPTLDFSKFSSNLPWLSGISVPILLIVFFAGVFVFNFLAIYFLRKKDVKQLFEKPVLAKGETN
ncbi:MAG: hypothetical protein HZB50_06985 [Chloroflexi bacterium]|nr:hypothetical protein [Chloroflexota bacterium]